jgi:hypothetical protein
MAIINFDGEKRRDTREPQTTKDELLRPPPPASTSAFAPDLNTPRNAVGLNELPSGVPTWDFDSIADNASPSMNDIAQVKQEMAATPAPERGNRKRPLTPTDAPRPPLSERAMKRARQTSEERYGRKTGVIDLTLDESSSEEEDAQPVGPLPERQFVPGANEEPSTPHFDAPNLPRTFVRGLGPYAAHHRPAPITHRSKPPIKPENRRQSSQLASPAQTGRPVFNRTSRPLTPANNVNSTTRSNPSISGSTQYSQRAPIDPSTANSSTTPVVQKTGGPFVDDDNDSDGDEESAKKDPRKTVSRTSVTRLMDRPRNDTPVRASLVSMLEESKAMRGRAHGRIGGETEGFASSPITHNPNQMDVDQPEVDMQQSEGQSFLGVPRPR